MPLSESPQKPKFKRIRLSSLSKSDLTEIEQGNADFCFIYRGKDVKVYVESGYKINLKNESEPVREKVDRIIAVVDPLTGKSVPYIEAEILGEIGSALRDRDQFVDKCASACKEEEAEAALIEEIRTEMEADGVLIRQDEDEEEDEEL